MSDAPALTRRDVLVLLGATAAACASPLADLPLPPAALTADPFTLGVASGDPVPEGVILWTRLAVDPTVADGAMPAEPVAVGWEIARDAAFRRVVAAGWDWAQPQDGHAFEVDATDLPTDTRLYYRFVVGDWTSPVGRTRTAPAPGAPVTSLRIVLASCQDWRDGYWTAWEDAVAQEPDLVLFVGDYIYENAGTDVREHAGGEAVDLAGYRTRYAQYRSDPALQAAHAACPWVVTWDDHEVDNDYAPDTPEDGASVTGAAFDARRADAWRAFREAMPLRAPKADADGAFQLYRRLGWGDLLDLFVLDTRQYRDGPGDRDDTDRTMLGATQRAWLVDQLGAGGTRWRALVQSLVMADLTFGGIAVNRQQWDAFTAERRAVLDAAASAPTLVVSGDRHAGLLAHLGPEGAGGDVVAVEVSSNSISSDGDVDAGEAAFKAAWANQEHVDYAQAARRGYALLDVTPDAITVTFRVVERVGEPGAPASTDASFTIARDLTVT
ncbi:MAG: alkaline phosphatase D family protein [Alphaproteobacteria bacterium]|nr:alkaline phosphatase D family protein [Alphaproteobacteria bacterium]